MNVHQSIFWLQELHAQTTHDSFLTQSDAQAHLLFQTLQVKEWRNRTSLLP